jgi:hypothetical protein
MEIVEPRDFVAGGSFRESAFREAIKSFDWAQYKDKPVLIQGCASITLPTWAFLVITAELAPYAKSISYGEVKNPIPIAGKLGASIES